MISRGDLPFGSVARLLGNDWVNLAHNLNVPASEIKRIRSATHNQEEQAIQMLRYWQKTVGPQKATGNALEKALKAIRRQDIVLASLSNVERVADTLDTAIGKAGVDQSGFDSFKEELGPSRTTSRGTSLGREASLDAPSDEQDIMKVG